MNSQILFTLIALFSLVTAAPIPIPDPLVIIDVTQQTTTTIPVAKVIIGNGWTSTIQLTTLSTATPDQETQAPAPVETPTTTPVITTAPTTTTAAVEENSTYVSTDENGVAHVWVTLAKKIIVDQNGNTVSVSTQELVQNNAVQAQETGALVQDINVVDVQTQDATAQNEQTQNAQTTESKDTTTSTTSSSSSSSSKTTTSSTVMRKNYTTTWSNGEVFYSYLSQGLVSPINVAPIVAATTTTLSNTADVAPTTGPLALTSSDDKLLLPTLTVGLPKDKNVQINMQNPATVSMTNTDVSTTSVVITTPSSTSKATTETTDASPATTAGSGVIGDSLVEGNTAETPDAQPTSEIDSSKYLTKVPTVMVYSPYNNDGTCKDYTSVANDLQMIYSKGIRQIRVYGADCNYMTTVLTVSKLLGISVNQGFWISAEGVNSIDTSVDNLIEYINSDASPYGWEIFSFITVGNEAVIAGYCNVADLIAKISEVKAKLRAAGYNGDVTTSEPPVTFENHPELCTQSEIDFVGINPHSYFDTYSAAEDAGTFVAGQIGIVKQYCGDKRIFITETGYPSAGAQNGRNIPSADNQRIAIQSILDIVGEDITILTTFDDYWKQPGDYGIEQFFGTIQLLQ